MIYDERKVKNKVIFRVDGGANIGLGHIMRSLSLADGLRRKNSKNLFIIKDTDSEVIERIICSGNLIEKLPLEIDLEKDLNLTIGLIKKYQPNLVITDSYEINQHYLEQLKKLNIVLMSIDDLANMYFCSDVVLNQNIGVKANDYSVEKDTKLLLGPKYVLLRKEFKNKRSLCEIKEEVENILVIFGGTDSDNQTLKAVKALRNIKSAIEIVVVMGPGYQYEGILREEIKTDSRFILARDPKNIFNLMMKADIAISAGGSTCYELAYLGVPNIIIIVADNQKKIAAGLDSYGASINLGWFKDVVEKDIKKAIDSLMENRERRENMSRNGKKLVDGKGVERVVDEVMRQIAWKIQ
ncbi:MAG: UDP-2,4-diacetamido-2,4,6-trideoxy-beta-L-altropyranose hydrolase [bacterium]|nr:UDP-2,4-diacetamido-2,4,6-trideoxy-beta-L-altropyranose hydrolase [bacterium]